MYNYMSVLASTLQEKNESGLYYNDINNLPVSLDLVVLASLSLVGVSLEGLSATPPVGPLLILLVAVVAAAEEEEAEGADSAVIDGRLLVESTTCGVTIGT